MVLFHWSCSCESSENSLCFFAKLCLNRDKQVDCDIVTVKVLSTLLRRTSHEGTLHTISFNSLYTLYILLQLYFKIVLTSSIFFVLCKLLYIVNVCFGFNMHSFLNKCLIRFVILINLIHGWCMVFSLGLVWLVSNNLNSPILLLIAEAWH